MTPRGASTFTVRSRFTWAEATYWSPVRIWRNQRRKPSTPNKRQADHQQDADPDTDKRIIFGGAPRFDRPQDHWLALLVLLTAGSIFGVGITRARSSNR